MINIGTSSAITQGPRNTTFPPSFPEGSSPSFVKTRICSKYNSAEGCKFGDKCRFAHGEWELRKPTAPSYDDPRSLGHMHGRVGGRIEPPPVHGAAAGFGASATAKISINASLAGAVIGKNGVNSKKICRITGSKLSIRDHDSDPSVKNIELEGSFDQIKQASAMVHELIVNVSSVSGPPPPKGIGAPHGHNPARNLKTKLCDNFAKGSCTFGERCHFAHGAEELRKTGM